MFRFKKKNKEKKEELEPLQTEIKRSSTICEG